MGAVETQRTLVKSLPELWAELSAAEALGRLLGGHFGEIRITRLEPESAISWESELAEGRVELKPSGFGTRVRLTAVLGALDPQPDREPATEVDGLVPAASTPGPAPDALEPGAHRPEPSRAAVAHVADAITRDALAADAHVPDLGEHTPWRGFWARLRRRWAPGAGVSAPPADDRAPGWVEPSPEATERGPEPDAPAFRHEAGAPLTEPEPAAALDPELEPAAAAACDRDPEATPTLDPERARDALSALLDEVGAARHRPFSR